jgi:hypothetical protein
MRSTRSSTKKAAKAKLSGFVADGEVQNKKIVFDEDDVHESDVDANNDADVDNAVDNTALPAAESDEDDAVEEVKGSTARESTQKVREVERQIAKETTSKKKRKKKESARVEEDEQDAPPEEFSDDFFKVLDEERADKQQLAKQQKKQQKLEKKILGKHTTFVVEDENNLMDAPKKFGQNIEVIALGSGQTDEDDQDEEDRRNLLSATLGSTSAASTLFARGQLTGGASMTRSCESRKRGTKDDEAWKRSKVKVYRSGPGRAALFFAKGR